MTVMIRTHPKSPASLLASHWDHCNILFINFTCTYESHPTKFTVIFIPMWHCKRFHLGFHCLHISLSKTPQSGEYTDHAAFSVFQVDVYLTPGK